MTNGKLSQLSAFPREDLSSFGVEAGRSFVIEGLLFVRHRCRAKTLRGPTPRHEIYCFSFEGKVWRQLSRKHFTEMPPRC